MHKHYYYVINVRICKVNVSAWSAGAAGSQSVWELLEEVQRVAPRALAKILFLTSEGGLSD